MVMLSPQEGQSICVPAPAWSTASSCSQFGQLKTMSIILRIDLRQPKAGRPGKPENNGGHFNRRATSAG
jgi:hypothetical protein